MAAAHLNRSQKRTVQIIFRATVEDRAELKRRAQEAGCSLQTYLERVALGHHDAQDLPPGRPVKHQQELTA